jgi:hypothetical protein
MPMVSADELRAIIEGLETSACDIESNARKMYSLVHLKVEYDYDEFGLSTPFPDSEWIKPNSDPWAKLQRDVTKRYQQWYSTACVYVDRYAPERIKEFNNNYNNADNSSYGFIDAIKLNISENDDNQKRVVDRYISWFHHQRDILSSIPSIVEAKANYTENANPIDLVCNLCERFHLIARQLRANRKDRSLLDVSDEYDLQYLFHALLYLHFSDIRPEEWTPSYAGSSARMDFLLKPEQIVIETKMSRKGLGAKELGNELIEDIARYQAHPDCKVLICFVYDPGGLIANPRGVENDLNESCKQITVQVFIRP